MPHSVQAIQIQGRSQPEILTPQALQFVADLQREFGPQRERLLEKRVERQARIAAGELPDFLAETARVRSGDWKVASCPKDLEDRRVEITGPAESKMMINALNSGAKVFMADIEDSLSPTWDNVIGAQVALRDAVRRTLSFESPEGKKYRLNDRTATLLVRPRGWHLEEKHALLNGKPISASLFDFGLYFFHNAQETLKRGTGPYFYLPKMESHLEARLWNDVFNFSQERLGIPRGTIRATVLIETILASFEMDEILYELREHASGLNAGRWDYIFSLIKKFRDDSTRVLPDRAMVTMGVPFMKAYAELLVKTCHKRGAHAMGGMSAFIPNRREPQVTENALAKVREDKDREANAGFDGTWVAHPDLVSVAQEIFDRKFGKEPNQKSRQRDDVKVVGAQLIDTKIAGGRVTETGIRANVNVALQYIERWISGTGAAAIHNLMEDAATAEISRAQLWQWIRHGVTFEQTEENEVTTKIMSREIYTAIRTEELTKLGGESAGKYLEAAQVLDELVLSESFADFLTIPAYRYL